MGSMKGYSRKVWVFITITCFILLWSILHIALRSTAITEPYVVAHRGGAGFAPENTLAAITASISRGDLYIEVDVQRTADNVLILMHDSTVNRVTDGIGVIGDWNWKDLGILNAGSHFGAEYSGETIPTLEQVMKVIADTEVTLFLEVKNPDKYPGIDKQIKEILEVSGLTEEVVIASFNREWLKQFRQIAPKTQTGLICWWKHNMSHSSESRVLIVFWGAIIADPTLIKRAHDGEYEVAAWTVNNRFLMNTLLWLGVDGIVTDYPGY